MCSPVPYSRPKSGFLNSLTTKFRTKKGSFIYAPNKGRVIATETGLVLITKNNYRHVLSNVSVINNGSTAEAGERIGYARGRSVRYKRFSPNNKQIETLSVIERDNNSIKPTDFFHAASKRIPTEKGGIMGPGNEVKVVWHTSESDPASGIGPVADWVQLKKSQYTLIWNPYEKDRRKRFLQFYPAGAGARALKNAGTYATNRHGKLCIQICVIGRKNDAPLSKSPLYGRRELMEWLDRHGVPRKLTYDQGNPLRNRTNWEKSGHTAHVACPGNDHTDPGLINTRKLFGP